MIKLLLNPIIAAVMFMMILLNGCNENARIEPSATAKSTSADLPKPPPNVIIILTDDQGYMDVGFNGGTDIPTPNIDRIAHEGVRFTRGYVSHPVCGPSRAGLLTGRYQGRFGFFQNPNNNPRDPKAGLPLSEQLISNLVKPAGYHTIAIGKWHMGAHPSLRPLQRGFDEFFGFLSGSHHYFADQFVNTNDDTAQKPRELHRSWLRRNGVPVKTKGYLTDILSEEAVASIKRNRSAPFLMYLAYNAPHSPLEASKKYLDRFAHITNPTRRTYAAMVSAVDDGVGRILDTLDAEGLADNTIIFFLSDNGGIVQDEKSHPDYRGAKKGSSWNGSDNGLLRAGKGTMFEGGIRVPFAMRWPDIIPANTVYHHPVISLDIVGTILAINGLAGETGKPLDGKNLIPYITGKQGDTAPHDALFWRQVIIPGRMRFATISGHKKYYEDQRYSASEVYNLNDDISEKTDIAEQEPATVKRGHKAIKEWIRDMPKDHAITTSSIKW